MAESKGYIRSIDERGSINIAENVVAVIAASAAVDIDGVYGLYQSPGRDLTTASGRKGISKGIRVSIEEENVVVDVFIIAEIGYSVSEIGVKVQKKVMSAIEETVGVKVGTVNVHICGVSLKKAKQQA